MRHQFELMAKPPVNSSPQICMWEGVEKGQDVCV